MPQASVCKWRAGEHPYGAGWASVMAWCVAWLLWPRCKRSLRFSCCMLSHNRVRAQVNVELWRFISMGLCSQRCTCAMDVTVSEAGVAAVCERVLAGHCGLQRLSGLEPLLISSRVIAWMALCYCAWCHCLLVSTVKFQLCPCLRTLGRSLFVV